MSYAAASSPRRVIRPLSVSALALLGIVVGSALFFCNAITMVIDAGMMIHPDRGPLPGQPPLDPLLVKFQAANAIAGTVFAAVLLGAALASLTLSERARKIILAWSIAFILLGVARTIGQIAYVGPATIAFVAKHQPENADYASGYMAHMVMPKAIGSLALYCILPILYWTIWTRRNVKEAFRPQEKW